jgi:hypothetical protein
MGTSGFWVGYYCWSALAALRRAAVLEWLTLVGSWVVMPVLLVEGVRYPVDAVGLWCWITGAASPSGGLSPRELVVEAIATIFGLAGVLFVQGMAAERLYRKAGYAVALWPLAVLVGIAGNGAWWWGTAVLDPTGTFAGFVPALVAALMPLCVRPGYEGKTDG